RRGRRSPGARRPAYDARCTAKGAAAATPLRHAALGAGLRRRETTPRGIAPLRRHDRPADRPERDAGKLKMRPGKGQPDDRYRPDDRGDEVAEREPPAGEHKPDDIADHP